MTEFKGIPSRIVVHCSASDDGLMRDRDTIRSYHLRLGWEDIGYHFLIEKIGSNVALLPGRSPRFEGAHCRAAGRNHDSIGVCIVGDFDKAKPQDAVFYSAAKAVAVLCMAYGIPADRVSAHREWEPKKTCPGRLFDMVLFREAVGAYLEALHAVGLAQD